jgi:hypothetical protein
MMEDVERRRVADPDLESLSLRASSTMTLTASSLRRQTSETAIPLLSRLSSSSYPRSMMSLMVISGPSCVACRCRRG